MPNAMVDALPMQPTISRWSGISFAASGTAARHAPMACSVVIVIALSRAATNAAMASRLCTLTRRRTDKHHCWTLVLRAVRIRFVDRADIFRTFDREIRHTPGVERRLDQSHA